MKGFEQVWSSVAITRGGEEALPDLKPLVLSVHNEVTTSPVNLPALKSSLVKLLQYLSGEGRTDANCLAIDLFSVPTTGACLVRNRTCPKISMLCWR